ncbi:MAG: FmdB family zinc ribbon protein [Chthoniobacterales bacterium]
MPTYEYECSKCHHHFDAFQSMSSEAYTTCPKEQCQMKKWGKGKVKRLLGAGAGFLFKGSGFYITDYRSEGYKSSAKSDAAGDGKSADSAEKKSPAASETKTTSSEKSAPEKKSSPAKSDNKKKI